LYGCGTWYLTLRKEYKLRAFKNRALRIISGSMIEEGAGGWRTLHNGVFHNLYTSPNIIQVIKSRRMRWMGHAAHIREMRNAYNILVGKPEGKRSLGRPRCR
jgi:hypothetical protein